MSCAFSSPTTAISINCIGKKGRDGKTRCVAPGHQPGRHEIGADGQCKNGRQMAVTKDQCSECRGLMVKNSGFILNFSILKRLTSIEAGEIIKNTAGEQLLCQTCAGAHNTRHTGLFESFVVRRAAVKKFVENFLGGAHIIHHHEFLNGVEQNWCDICGRPLSPEEEEEAGGICRGIIAVCACKHCDEIAHQVVSDLPRISFFDALEKILGRPLARRSRAIAPAPKVDPIVKTAPRGQRFNSVIEIYQAIMGGQNMRKSGRAPNGGTECVVHANAPKLCKCLGGTDDWRQMKAVVRGGQAFGFGRSCQGVLKAEGIVLPDKTLQEAVIVDVQGGTLQSDHPPRSVTPSRRPPSVPSRPAAVQMEFINPHASRMVKSSAGREVPRDRIVADAKRALEAALILNNQRIVVAEKDVDSVEADIVKQLDEIVVAQSESDQELRELMIDCANERIEELLPSLAEKQAALAAIKREREEMVSAGTKPFRKVSQNVRRPEKPKKKDEGASSDTGKNGGRRHNKRGDKK